MDSLWKIGGDKMKNIEESKEKRAQDKIEALISKMADLFEL